MTHALWNIAVTKTGGGVPAIGFLKVDANFELLFEQAMEHIFSRLREEFADKKYAKRMFSKIEQRMRASAADLKLAGGFLRSELLSMEICVRRLELSCYCDDPASNVSSSSSPRSEKAHTLSITHGRMPMAETPLTKTHSSRVK